MKKLSKIDALAKEFIELELAKKNLENRINEIKATLRAEAAGETFLYEDLGMKVTVGEPVEETGIDAKSLGLNLIANNRTEEFLSVATVTKTALNKLEDGKILAEQFKVAGSLREGTVKVSPFSKADMKALQD